MHFFFFSSRRRHTRFDCDWSSDVCSSDLWPALRARSLRSGETAGKVAEPTRARPSVSATIAIVLAVNCPGHRSEEHTSELQSQSNLVCRLLLEKKKKKRLRSRRRPRTPRR